MILTCFLNIAVNVEDSEYLGIYVKEVFLKWWGGEFWNIHMIWTFPLHNFQEDECLFRTIYTKWHRLWFWTNLWRKCVGGMFRMFWFHNPEAMGVEASFDEICFVNSFIEPTLLLSHSRHILVNLVIQLKTMEWGFYVEIYI